MAFQLGTNCASNVQDIDELIEMFKAADDRNYTLFTYVNELNQEVAKLEDQVKLIHSEIDSVQQQDAARENEHQRSQQEVLLGQFMFDWRPSIKKSSCCSTCPAATRAS